MSSNQIDNSAQIADDCIVNGSKLAQYSRLKRNVEFRDSELGEYSYVSSGSVVNKSVIGKFTSIGPGTYIGLWEHNTDVSTHSFYLYETSGYFVKGYRNYKKDHLVTEVGCDVWIGANVSIKKGVRIGHGAIIGSSTVVTKDVPPYAIIIGNPGKIIRYRFSDDDIEMFLKVKWWDAKRTRIEEMIQLGLFDDFSLFKEFVKEHNYEL